MPDTITVVLTKPAAGSQVSDVDLSSYLNVSETIASFASATAPLTSPALVSSISPLPQGLHCIISAGKEGITYGIKLEVNTSLSRVLSVAIVVNVHTNNNVPYETQSPYAYQSLVDKIDAGASALAKAVFILPSDAVAASTNSQVTWTLMDASGVLYANGNAYDYNFTSDSFQLIVEANAVVNVPSTVPPSRDNSRYQIRWELSSTDGSFSSQYMFESITVLGVTTTPEGAQGGVELFGDPAQVSLVLREPYTNVAFEVFGGNTKLTTAPIPVPMKVRVSSGWYYEAQVDTSAFVPQLDPYAISWKYSNANTPWAVNRETSRLFVVTPSIMTAIEDMKAMVSRAQTTLFQLPDMIFSPEVILSHLRTGRDDFNAAAGVLTNFTMTYATGAIRSFWLAYAYVSILRSQYIAEGEKAFDFQGQAISLNVDRTQYYQGLANEILQQAQNDVKPFKTNLVKKGVSGGDGDMNKVPAAGSVGVLGLSMTPASQWSRGVWPLWNNM